MGILIRNNEYKMLIIKLALVQLIFIVCITIFYEGKFNELNKLLVKKNIAIAGKVINLNGNLENDIVRIITKSPTKEEYDFGVKVLNKYSYTEDIRYNSNTTLKEFIFSFKRDMFIILFLVFIVFIIIISIDIRKFYISLKSFSNSIERIMDGKFDVNLSNSREGEFNILGHNINLLSYRLKSTIDKLKEDKEFLKNMVSDISHQLKTPLASLIIINELLINNKEISREKREDFLNKVENQLERMEWLVVSLLKYARIEAGAIIFKKKQVDFSILVKEILINLDFLIIQKNIKINIDKGEFKLIGDTNWLKEALTNIIKNAIEHSYKDGIINIKFEGNKLFKRIYIEDFGEGINQKDLPYIFDRFKKTNNKLKPNSIGIGLSLSKSIIKNLDGDIHVKSKVNKGTTFVITFLQ